MKDSDSITHKWSRQPQDEVDQVFKDYVIVGVVDDLEL